MLTGYIVYIRKKENYHFLKDTPLTGHLMEAGIWNTCSAEDINTLPPFLLFLH